MNQKERIRKRILRLWMPVQILAILAVLGIIVAQLGFTIDPLVFMLIVNPLFILAIATIVFIAFSIRCPSCRKPLGLPFFLSVLQPSGKWINRDWGLNFCPSCGTDFQKEIKDEEGSNKFQERTSLKRRRSE